MSEAGGRPRCAICRHQQAYGPKIRRAGKGRVQSRSPGTASAKVTKAISYRMCSPSHRQCELAHRTLPGAAIVASAIKRGETNMDAKFQWADRPLWVRIALFGVPTRRAALIWVRIPVALAIPLFLL